MGIKRARRKELERWVGVSGIGGSTRVPWEAATAGGKGARRRVLAMIVVVRRNRTTVVVQRRRIRG